MVSLNGRAIRSQITRIICVHDIYVILYWPIDGWEQYCLSAYMLYRHLQQYCSHPSTYFQNAEHSGISFYNTIIIIIIAIIIIIIIAIVDVFVIVVIIMLVGSFDDLLDLVGEKFTTMKY